MAKITMTRNDLYNVDQQIIQIKKTQQAIALLLSKPISKFYDSAAKELSVTKARFTAVLLKFVEVDDHGKPQSVKPSEENAVEKWKFKGSYKLEATDILIMGAARVEEYFNEQVNSLMQQEINIDW